MFCGECGAKNEKNAAFCEECGAKLREVPEKKEKKEKKDSLKESDKKEESKKKKKTKKNQKKQRVIIGLVVVLLIALFAGYKHFEKKASPETLVKEYLTAINNQDYEKIYELAGRNTVGSFITKDAYIAELKEEIDEKNILGTITIGNTTYENGKLTARVSFNSSKLSDATGGLSGIVSSSTNILSIKVEKDSGKQYLIFSKWKISDDLLLTFDTVDDFEISVPEGTTISFDGQKVSNKYVDSSSDDNLFISYKLPKVLKSKTTIDFTLPDKTKISKEITPSTSGYQLSITRTDLSDETKEKLLNKAKEDYQTIINGLLKKEKFKSIKSDFSSKKDLSNLQEVYEKYADSLEESNYTYSNYSYSKSTINSVGLSSTKDCLYKVNVYLRYTYDRKYKDEEANSTYNYGYFTLYYTYENGYKLVDVENIPSL